MNTVLTMKRSLTRLQRYVESMNSIQRLEDLKPQKASVPFFSLCGQLKETGEILRGQEGFQFSAQGDGALFLDRELLFQVYENLLSNAGRYAQTTVWTQVLLEGNMLSLTVRDDGPGFSPTALKRASDPYYRADKSPSPQGEMHFGLGLYLCRVTLRKARGALDSGKRPPGGRTNYCPLFRTARSGITASAKRVPEKFSGTLFGKILVFFRGKTQSLVRAELPAVVQRTGQIQPALALQLLHAGPGCRFRIENAEHREPLPVMLAPKARIAHNPLDFPHLLKLHGLVKAVCHTLGQCAEGPRRTAGRPFAPWPGRGRWETGRSERRPGECSCRREACR